MKNLENVTTKIGNKYKKWNNNKVVFIEAGTGKGKSHFVKNTLYEYAKLSGKKILLLSNRTNLLNQNIYELAQADKLAEGVIACYNYQKLDYQESHIKYKDSSEYIDLKSFDYIVCDECHYFFTDATFNKFTPVALKWILESKAIKIFMSATPRLTRTYVKEKVGEDNIITYPLKVDYSYIKKLYFYKNPQAIEDNMLDKLPPDEKVIYFNHSAAECYRLGQKYKDNSIFVVAKDNDLHKFVDTKAKEEMLKNEKFESQILFTTSCMDNGINIKDKSIKHIVIDIKDFDTMIQCLGRKRVIDSEDTVTVYIKNRNNEQLGGDVTGNNTKISIADEVSFSTTEEWIERHPRENTDTGIVYFGTDKELHINEIAYKKYEDNVKFAEILLKFAKNSKNKVEKSCPYACVVAMGLGVKWKMYDNENEIKTFEQYLEDNVGVRLFNDEKSRLKEKFEQAGLKDRTMGLGVLNGKLVDCELPYKIIPSKTGSTRYWMIIPNC